MSDELPIEVEGMATDSAEPAHPVTKALREIRATLGLTQQQLAKRLGASPATIASYEAGKDVNPSWSFLARLVTRTGYDPRRLFPDHTMWPEMLAENGAE